MTEKQTPTTTSSDSSQQLFLPHSYRLHFAYFSPSPSPSNVINSTSTTLDSTPKHESYHYSTLVLASSHTTTTVNSVTTPVHSPQHSHGDAIHWLSSPSSKLNSKLIPYKSFNIEYRKKLSSQWVDQNFDDKLRDHSSRLSIYEYTLHATCQQDAMMIFKPSVMSSTPSQHHHSQPLHTTSTTTPMTPPHLINNYSMSPIQSPVSESHLNTSTSFSDFEDMVLKRNEETLEDLDDDLIEEDEDLTSDTEDEDNIEYCVARYIHFGENSESLSQSVLNNEGELKKKFVELLSLSYHVNIAQLYDLYLVIDTSTRNSTLESNSLKITGLLYTMEYIPSSIKLTELLSQNSIPSSTTSSTTTNSLETITPDGALFIFNQLLEVLMMFHSKNKVFPNKAMTRQLLENDMFIRGNVSSELQKHVGIYLNVESYLLSILNQKQVVELTHDMELGKMENIWNAGYLLFKLIVQKDCPNLTMGSIDEEKTNSILEENCSDRRIVSLVMNLLTNDTSKRPQSVFEILYSPWLLRFKKFRIFTDMKQRQQQFDSMNHQIQFHERMKSTMNQLLNPLLISSRMHLTSSDPNGGMVDAGGDGMDRNMNGVSSGGGSSARIPRKGTLAAVNQKKRMSLKLYYSTVSSDLTEETTTTSQPTRNGASSPTSSPLTRKNSSKSNLMVGMFKHQKSKTEVQITKPSHHDPKENVNVDEYYQLVLKQQKQSFKFDTSVKHNYFGVTNNQKTVTLLQNKMFGSDYYTIRCEQKITPLNNEIQFKIDKVNIDNEIVIGIISKDYDHKISTRSGILGSKKLSNSYGLNFVSGQVGHSDQWKKFTKNKLLRDKATVVVNFNFDKRCLNVKMILDDAISDLGTCFDDSIDIKIEWYFAVSLYREKTALTIVQ
ncbi:hypothetical protein C9374_005724 [Naegleria lovaniensis]|uniref:Protein kinase domain-containing protein n=1 Tax=Naegleria lovaniensis TaxID=51637 RepID=A0AA88KI84_NAELO|nr:uncharacterized protein C9374_005724 [Naegleria lovaniensis]KAG2381932.1 hypothetical protein C9374_005724 [Naegleria lovaniensis]